MGLVLVMEGGEPLIDDPARVRTFSDRGVRAIMLTHARDSALGGSGSPSIPGTNVYLRADRGLSDLGRAVLGEMAQVGMILDLAHASPATFHDALAAWSGPVMVSHGACAALYPSRRNLSDDQLRAIADRGGVVGIFVQTQFLGGTHLRSVADHIIHAVEVAGAKHVGLGLDMEEVTTGVLPAELQTARDLPKLTALLADRDLPPEVIEDVLGRNFLRFFATSLPARGS
jgi:membrane dipeptidase